MPISPLILFPVPEKKNKAKIKRVLVDSKKPIKKKKKKKEIFSRIYSELTVVWSILFIHYSIKRERFVMCYARRILIGYASKYVTIINQWRTNIFS